LKLQLQRINRVVWECEYDVLIKKLLHLADVFKLRV